MRTGAGDMFASMFNDPLSADGPGSGLIAYFGYGSLVCRATHRTQIVDAVPARLSGWRRHWRPRPDMPGFPAALLSVREQAGAACDGLLVFDREEHLPAIDRREARYRRVAIPRASLEVGRDDLPECPIYLYVAQEDVPAHPEPPLILRSYLDAVMQGFLIEHGEQGVRRFVLETDGFEIGFHEDRHEPAYPRAVRIGETEIALFETALQVPAAAIPG